MLLSHYSLALTFIALATSIPAYASVILSRQAPNTRQYIVFNKCPAPINLYIAGVLDSVIAAGSNVTKFLSTGAGFFYTDANGGAPNASGTLRAGFLGDDFYYMVQDPNHINTGLSVKPRDRPAVNGFCQTIECEDLSCTQAFPQPPTRFPPPTDIAPTPPYYRCPVTNTTYDITFCPTGSFPTAGSQIHPNDNIHDDKCLDVRGAVYANGTPVQIYDCNGTPAQRWLINRGSTKVQLAGMNFCLDAGSSPANGVALKIWQCYDNLPAQQWYFTDDSRIALEGRGLCVDLPNGDLTNANQVQTWQCTDGNVNQIWTL